MLYQMFVQRLGRGLCILSLECMAESYKIPRSDFFECFLKDLETNRWGVAA